jgi:hypothetical protein
MPAWINFLRTCSDELAGPMVQTIFVLRIFFLIYTSMMKKKTNDEMGEQMADGKRRRADSGG